MTSLLRIAAVGATLFGLSTPAFADGPSTTIVNNGNNNINVVVNIQGPQINLPPLSLPLAGVPGVPACSPGQGQGPQNVIVNQGNYNVNQIHNHGRGPLAPLNQIVNLGDGNRNFVRNR